MNDDRSTPGVAAEPDGATLHGGMEAALLEKGEGTGTGSPGVDGAPGRSRFSLSENAKRRIEIDARKCAREGVTRRDGCRWAFGTAEGQHWTAVFLLEGGSL